MDGFTEYVAHKSLKDIKDECWVALHFDDPTLAGAYASEVNGGGYGRILSKWGEISNKIMWLDNNLIWTGLQQTRITHLGGWNAEFNGDLMWVSQVKPPARILDGKGYSVAKGTIALSYA